MTPADGVVIYSVGFVSLSACAPADATRERIEDACNYQQPTGIESRWTISTEPKFPTGQDNPCPCDAQPGRRHWLLHC